MVKGHTRGGGGKTILELCRKWNDAMKCILGLEDVSDRSVELCVCVLVVSLAICRVCVLGCVCAFLLCLLCAFAGKTTVPVCVLGYVCVLLVVFVVCFCRSVQHEVQGAQADISGVRTLGKSSTTSCNF